MLQHRDFELAFHICLEMNKNQQQKNNTTTHTKYVVCKDKQLMTLGTKVHNKAPNRYYTFLSQQNIRNY